MESTFDAEKHLAGKIEFMRNLVKDYCNKNGLDYDALTVEERKAILDKLRKEERKNRQIKLNN